VEFGKRAFHLPSFSTSQQVIHYVEARAKVGRVGGQILDSSISAYIGMLTGEDPAAVEHYKGLYTVRFARIGMNVNSNKTSAMIMDEDKFLAFIGPHVYKRRFEKIDASHRERSLQKVRCERCGAYTIRQNLKN
jgi:hypothetical protein